MSGKPTQQVSLVPSPQILPLCVAQHTKRIGFWLEQKKSNIHRKEGSLFAQARLLNALTSYATQARWDDKTTGSFSVADADPNGVQMRTYVNPPIQNPPPRFDNS